LNPYVAPAWLPGGHAQTIFAALRRPPPVAFERERWETPDGDFIDLDWAGPRDAGRRLVLFHGLEGSSRSHYVRSIVGLAITEGWRCVVPHFRGCSGEINNLPRAYHSGDYEEIDWILRRVHSLAPQTKLDVVGVSLGGNAFLKWLGESGDEAAWIVAHAAVISAPFDLAAAGHALGRGFNRLYTRMFLGSLKRKSSAKLVRFPGSVDERAMLASRNLYEFDNAVTAPLHGFRDTDDYWQRASSWPGLAAIRVPTLIINARNDPFMPESSLERAREASKHVTLEFPAGGGHAGFLTGPFPGRHGWLAHRILEFLSDPSTAS
jgi:predicted alpha/beta-fold hydrolase